MLGTKTKSFLLWVRCGTHSAFSVDNWPRSVPIVFLGWEVGNRIQTGAVRSSAPIFTFKKDHFTRTGSGQTFGNPHEKDRFLEYAGGVMTKGTPAANPCRQAYIDHSGAGNDRSSWDPATTLFAVRGAGDFYTLHSTGHNLVNATSGANAWTEEVGKGEVEEKGEGGWKQSYLIQKSSTAAVKKAIDDLMLDPPKKRNGR
jgi:hypothetical protein